MSLNFNVGWSDIFGSKNTQSQSGTSSTSGTRDSTQTGKQTGKQTQTTQQQGQQQQQQSGAFLSTDANLLLENVIQALGAQFLGGGSVASEQSQQLASALGQSAMQIGQGGLDVEALVSAIREGEALNFAETTGAQIAQTKQDAGSNMGSFARLLDQRGQRELSTRLGTVEAQTRLQADAQGLARDQTAAQALQAALTGSMNIDLGNTQALQNLLSALGVAKGATQTVTGITDTTQSGTSELTQLQEMLQQLTEAFQQTTVSQSEQTNKKAGLFGLF